MACRHHGRVWWSLAVGVLGLGLGLPGLSCSEPFIGDTGIRRFGFDLWDVRCPSGMRVLFEKDTAAKVVGMVTVVGVGSAADPPGKEGLAHFVEHLTFRARHRDGPSVWTQFGRLGATGMNAVTAFDATTYYEFVAKDLLNDMVQTESDRFSNPLEGLDEDTFATEREVVRNELRQRNETGLVGQAFDWLQAAVFPDDHPYHHGTAGSHQSLSAITLDDARRFVAQHYRPDNMTILVIGDVALETAEAYVKAHLAPALYDAPAGAASKALVVRLPPAGPPPAPQVKPKGMQRHAAAITHPEVWIGWSIPGGFSRERFIGEFWASLVDGTFSYGQFGDDPDIADVDFFSHPGKEAGIFVCRITLTEGKHPQESAERVMKYLPWIDDEMYLGRRFLRLKALAMRQRAFAAETIQGRAKDRALFTHFSGSPGYFANVMDTIRNIDADDALSFANRYLGRQQAHIVFIEPLPPEQQLPPGPTGLGAGRKDDRDRLLTPAPESASIAASASRRLSGLRTVALPNGLTVILARRTTMPIVATKIGFHGGTYSANPIAVSDAAGRAIRLNFEQAPSDYGISFNFGSGPDDWSTTMFAGIDNLPRTLDILAFSLKSFDVEWPSDRFRASTLPFLRHHDETPDARADRAYRQALYGTHPWGQTALADDIDKVNADQIKSWFGAQRSPQNAALVIAGDIDLDKTEALVRDALGSFSGPASARVIAPPAVATPPALSPTALSPTAPVAWKTVIVQHRPHATQVHLSLGCLLPAADERREAVHDMAALLTHGDLNNRIRIQAGASYGVSARSWTIRGGSSGMAISADIDNAHIGQALTTIRRFMSQTVMEGFSENDIAWARFDLNSANLFAALDVNGLATALLRAWNRGWPLESVDRYPDYLVAARATDVDAAMRVCAGNQVLSLVGDQKAIDAGLREAGVDPATVRR
ncbi:MAG: zinc protease [Myxococcales bacterium]|nr:zinc protease [Myxococcales bacterium]